MACLSYKFQQIFILKLYGYCTWILKTIIKTLAIMIYTFLMESKE